MTNTPDTSTQNTPEHKPRPMIDLLVSIIIPSFILMKLSGDDDLGATMALIAALLFPLGWGLYERLQYKKFNYFVVWMNSHELTFFKTNCPTTLKKSRNRMTREERRNCEEN